MENTYYGLAIEEDGGYTLLENRGEFGSLSEACEARRDHTDGPEGVYIAKVQVLSI